MTTKDFAHACAKSPNQGNIGIFLTLVMMVLISSMTCASIFIIFFSIYIFFHLSLAHLEEPLSSEILNDLNDLDLNDRFSRFFGYLQCVFSCFAMFLQ